ncbi:hypothetical protein F2P81_000512 [Scophthalmus maximus]|uniref:RRM domain-containing protein n=1 Tax=Scophthalmus maximus TaxID=52904 RepID=A0A6A4TPS8_SCOMX|nr:hypothetical protein F2P81_000512 [Scophthalmus maximus]
MNYTTKVVQVTNVSPSTTSEQMRTLFGFLGTIDELKLFPPDDSQMPVTSRVCFVKFQEPESVGVSQHLTNTVFVDRALIVVPFAEGSIPDEAKALSLLAPANAIAGILPGGGLLPTPNPMANAGIGGNPFGPNMDALAAFGFPGTNMNSQAADQLLKFMTDPKMNPLAAGLNLNSAMKAEAQNKEIEEAMKRVREAQSLISAAIEPGSEKRRRSRSQSRSPVKKSPKKRISRSPSPRRHKKEKKRDKERDRDRDRKTDKDRSREEHEHSSSKKKKSKDKEREWERKSDGEKGDVKITRDYDEEEQGYDSEKERERRKDSEGSALSPRSVEGNGTARSAKQAKVNGADDHHEEDMDVSD